MGTRGARSEERWATSDTLLGDGVAFRCPGLEGLEGLQTGKLDAARREKQQDPRSRSVATRSLICSGERKDMRDLMISLGAGVRK